VISFPALRGSWERGIALSGLYYEDFDVGQTIETRGMTVTEAHVVAFAGLSGDFNPIHTDEVAARDTPFGTRIAHGQLGMILSAGLINQTGVHSGTTIALLGYREWTFLKPILFGDTIRVRVTVENKRETKKPDRGILMRKIEILNQREEIVQRGYSDLMVKRKPS
jgi:acyl dehydratase